MRCSSLHGVDFGKVASPCFRPWRPNEGPNPWLKSSRPLSRFVDLLRRGKLGWRLQSPTRSTILSLGGGRDRDLVYTFACVFIGGLFWRTQNLDINGMWWLFRPCLHCKNWLSGILFSQAIDGADLGPFMNGSHSIYDQLIIGGHCKWGMNLTWLWPTWRSSDCNV